MNENFGKFKWTCYGDVKPDMEKFVYAYLPWDSDDVDIGRGDEFNFRDTDYWCYVYIPDAPKIEKELTLEEKIDRLEDSITKILKYLQI